MENINHLSIYLFCYRTKSFLLQKKQNFSFVLYFSCEIPNDVSFVHKLSYTTISTLATRAYLHVDKGIPRTNMYVQVGMENGEHRSFKHMLVLLRTKSLLLQKTVFLFFCSVFLLWNPKWCLLHSQTTLPFGPLQQELTFMLIKVSQGPTCMFR